MMWWWCIIKQLPARSFCAFVSPLLTSSSLTPPPSILTLQVKKDKDKRRKKRAFSILEDDCPSRGVLIIILPPETLPLFISSRPSIYLIIVWHGMNGRASCVRMDGRAEALKCWLIDWMMWLTRVLLLSSLLYVPPPQHPYLLLLVMMTNGDVASGAAVVGMCD